MVDYSASGLSSRRLQGFWFTDDLLLLPPVPPLSWLAGWDGGYNHPSMDVEKQLKSGGGNLLAAEEKRRRKCRVEGATQ